MNGDRREREALILDRLGRDGQVYVADLVKEFDVSEVTVRNTLRHLESRGLLMRTHGGARPSSIQHVLERRGENAEAKERIAQAAAALVRDGDTIMIEAGTTTSLLPRFLTGRRNIKIVTNSTLVLNQARVNPELHIIVTGGSFHRESESLVGSGAIRSIRDYNVRLAFVGTDGFSRDGLTTEFAEGADIITAMHEGATETWLLTDSSKYGRAGFVNVLGLSELTGIITDTDLPKGAVDEVSEHADVRAV